MIPKRLRKFFTILVTLATAALIISSVGGSLFFLIGN
jgi:hypothetical protein